MKNLLFALIFGTVFTIQAQYEVKINPIMAIFGEGDISGEYLISETFGVELSLQPFYGKFRDYFTGERPDGKQSGFGEKFRLKYYVSPYNGGDGSYVSMFVSNVSQTIKSDYEDYDYNTQTDVNYTEIRKMSYIGIGFEYGYKILLDSGFVFDYALGAGTYITNNSRYIPDPDDPEREAHPIKSELPFIISGKFAIGYRFGDY